MRCVTLKLLPEKEYRISFMGFPNNNGNTEIMFEWCEDLGTHLLNGKWEIIPNKYIKKMLVLCIT
jgi:hypothetical protein